MQGEVLSKLFFFSFVFFEETVDKAVATFGSLSGAVNCAGIAIASKVISKKGVHSLDSFMKVLSINLGGSFNVARLVAAQLANQQVDTNHFVFPNFWLMIFQAFFC